MDILTKSKYLTGLQCLKYLWIDVHEPEKIPPPEEHELYRYDEGTLVGELAKKLFPKGIDLAGLDFEENIQRTKEALKEKKPLFEAGFRFGDCFARADILVPVGNKWDIIEVKSATKVKDINLHDLSFQKYCYEGFGLKIRNSFLMHINNEYVRKGEINPKKLFVQEDITSEVNELVKDIKQRIDRMFKIIKATKCPNLDIGPHCSNPYECPIEECWDFLPEDHVGNLYRGGKKSFELIEMGIYSVKEIPDTIKLTSHQRLQRDCERSGKEQVDKESIKQFLGTLQYPLYFLDFETFNTAIPLFNGLKSYQQVPFQFSLHIVKDKKSKPKHYFFLASSREDPRKKFLSKLKDVLGNKGSIIVYNQSFEIKILKELSEAFPKHKSWAKNVIARIIDLLKPFKKFYYYHPLQRGSASIKVVLPVLTGKSYEGMDIADGGAASLAFLKMSFENVSEVEKNKVKKNLEKYCKLDTEGMIWIVDELKNKVNFK